MHGSQRVTYRGRSYNIPDDEPAESHFPCELPSSGEGLFYWDPAGNDGDGPEHCMLIGWTADADGIDEDNLAIRHTCSFEYAPGRSKVDPMPGQLVAFLEWIEDDENRLEVLRELSEQREAKAGR